MKIKKNYVAVIAVFISALMLMVGCTNKENRNGDEVNITKLKKGAYRNSFEGEIN
jgi:hypothetical protein